jgi:hypothetical protein
VVVLCELKERVIFVLVPASVPEAVQTFITVARTSLARSGETGSIGLFGDNAQDTYLCKEKTRHGPKMVAFANLFHTSLVLRMVKVGCRTSPQYSDRGVGTMEEHRSTPWLRFIQFNEVFTRLI